MAGISREDSGVGSSTEGFSSGQQLCESGEALAEWRSSEQLENGTPSTSPPYWDTDDDNDFGPKPCELYGKYTWKIDKFSQINKRELRSNAFEVGGYKWYILIYPQGCDVCNHLSLFLCVANHDKLLPGWSHFAQFTIAVVNKDPKKSKYSDTLHRFWKKEHDWGWKKFMELSKVLDGFIDADTLIIKAQVQVIRERADRPFRCLDCQYRRELVRVYLTNVEQICRRFVEDRRSKLGKLIEDKARWSSFCAFWLGIDQNARRRMSREKTDLILRVVVKHFFIEKEVTSTLVMDSLYSGLKALEGQAKSKNGRGKSEDAEDSPVPIVRIDKDMFILVEDVLLLLERAALEPLPPKDDKGPQTRMKDGGSGEDMSKDSIERDERRLTELGRRTIEIFVLAHVFSSKIEVAYQEAVALKRQEELIREEAAWLAETEQKAKRGAAEKEKKSKKKQGKQKRNNRKGKDKGRDEMLDVPLQESPADEVEDFRTDVVEPVPENPDTLEDVSDVSDSVDFVPKMLQPDSEDRDASLANWDTDTSEIHPATEASGSGVSGLSSVQNGTRDGNSTSAVDDSSSTCSTDSVPSVVTNGPYKGSLHPNHKSQKSPSRGRNQRGKETTDATDGVKEAHSRPSEPTKAATRPNDASGSCKAESEAVVHSLQDRIKELEKHMVKKVEEEVFSLRRELSTKDQVDTVRPPKEKATTVPASTIIPPKNLPPAIQAKSASKNAAAIDPVSLRNPSSNIPQPTAPLVNSAPKFTEKPSVQMPVTSRPLSAPINSGPRPTAPVASTVRTPPLLARSVSAAGRLGPDPSPATHNSVPQSYRNAIMGTSITSSSTGFTQPHSPRSAINPSQLYSQLPGLTSSPMFLPQSSDRMEPNSVKPSISFGMLNLDVFQNGRPQWVDCPERSSSTKSMHYDDPSSSQQNEVHNLGFYKPVVHRRLQDNISTDSTPACTSGRQTNHGAFTDEFPHLDIINDLLDDEHSIAKQTRASTSFQSFSNGPHHLNRQFSFPLDPGMSSNMGPSTSCRFERARSYHDDGLQRGYGSLSGAHFDALLPDMIPQANPGPFLNEHVDGFLPTQWQTGGSDYSYLGMGNVEGDGYPYHVPDYSNLVCGVNGYTVFRPSNGH
ncbi:hypothetical protein RHMOL_Rhmol04G0305700 [Rhododendron molle]|uniref:Uncharacterized protein n=1 Tax=Rhododendron molle TaxID=49168 RepID=A0ACC0P7B1_RHOML|nr:hypothetical protein RHMOL_Rhmol04G0305700 [Rhododendron molle]